MSNLFKQIIFFTNFDEIKKKQSVYIPKAERKFVIFFLVSESTNNELEN